MLLTFAREGLLTVRANAVKPFIISVAGTVSEVRKMYRELVTLQGPGEAATPSLAARGLVMLMEINLSCPNIPSMPPPAYEPATLASYLDGLAAERRELVAAWGEGMFPLQVGLKVPPYVYGAQFEGLNTALRGSGKTETGDSVVAFLTATNTLGSCLVLNAAMEAVVKSTDNGMGIGGLGGEALHPLALGNVKILRTMLDTAGLADLTIIGVGGVSDVEGYRRMRTAGADVVGIGTALGGQGDVVFSKIIQGLSYRP